MVQGMMPNYLLYMNSPEIHAAVQGMADIAERYRASKGDRHELFADLIRFFGEYDRTRTDEVESLKNRLDGALKQCEPMAELLHVWHWDNSCKRCGTIRGPFQDIQCKNSLPVEVVPPLCPDSPDGNHHVAPIGSDEEWMPSKAPCYYCGDKQVSWQAELLDMQREDRKS